MYCVSHAALMQPGELPRVLLVAGEDGDRVSPLDARIGSPGSESRTACDGGGVTLPESCAAGVDEYRRTGVLPLVADSAPRAGNGWLPAAIASRRLIPPAPRAALVSAVSAPRLPSRALGVGLYRHWLVSDGPRAALHDCSASFRTGVRL